MNENQIKQPIGERYRKYSEEEQRNYYKAFEKSHLNLSDFCKANGISRSALYEWCNKFKKKSNDFCFSELNIKKPLSIPLTNEVAKFIAL